LPERHDIPSLDGCAYLNAGTNGPMPRAAIDAMAAEAQAASAPRIGRAAFERLLDLRVRVRAAAARAIGAEEDEVALTSSTSHGIGLVCAGLDWSAGGEIVTTTEEHPGLEGPLDELVKRHGMVVRAVPSADVIDAIGPATRMVAVSHVLWTTGLILPMAEISAAAHAVGATVLVDGAQSGGAIPLDMHATGADFYAVSGQKWLLGPQGTGALWVHPRMHDVLRPALPSYFSYADGHVGPLRPGGARFDSGSLDPTVLAGFATAMEWIEGQPGGRAAWLAQAAENAAAARRRLALVADAEVHDPGGPCSGLIALRLHRHEPAAVTALAERDVLVRFIPDTPYLRVSVGAWTDETDVEALAAGLEALPD
jgi:L-cysteine/cystine lyase